MRPRAPYAFPTALSTYPAVYTPPAKLGGGNANSAGMWWQGSSYWLDLANNYGVWNGLPVTPGSLITDTHAQTIEANSTTGLYSPFTANTLVRTDLGLQTVPTKIQLLSSVADLTTTWSAVNATVVSSAIMAFDATNTLQLVTSSNGNGNRVQQNSPALTNGATYTQVFEMRANSSNFGGIVIKGTSTQAGAIYNLSTGAVVSTAGTNAVSAAISRSYNGNWLGSLTFTAAAAEVVQPGVGVSDGSTYAFTVFPSAASGTIYAGIGNLYLGAFAVPPILSAATVNGNQQVISGLASQLAGGVGGVVQFRLGAVDTTQNGRIVSISDGSANNRLVMYVDVADSGIKFNSSSGGAGGSTITVGQTVSANVVYTLAYAWDQATGTLFARSVGQSAPGSVSNTAPVGMSQLSPLGSGYNAVNNNFGFTCKLALFPGPQDAGTFNQLFARATAASYQ